MDRDSAISGLITLGLSLGEAKTYVALLENGPSEATPLSRLADVPQPKIYSYLKDLEARYFVDKVNIEGKPNKFNARSYQLVIESLEKNITEKRDAAIESLSRLETSSKQDLSREYVTLFQGEKAVNLRLREELLAIRKNAVVLESEHYKDIIQQLQKERPNIKLTRPVEKIRDGRNNLPRPFQEMLEMMDFGQMEENQPLMLFIDHDDDMASCKSTIIAAHPVGNEDPLLVHITHPVIVNFQIKLVKIILDMLDRIQQSQNM